MWGYSKGWGTASFPVLVLTPEGCVLSESLLLTSSHAPPSSVSLWGISGLSNFHKELPTSVNSWPSRWLRIRLWQCPANSLCSAKSPLDKSWKHKSKEFKDGLVPARPDLLRNNVITEVGVVFGTAWSNCLAIFSFDPKVFCIRLTWKCLGESNSVSELPDSQLSYMRAFSLLFWGHLSSVFHVQEFLLLVLHFLLPLVRPKKKGMY